MTPAIDKKGLGLTKALEDMTKSGTSHPWHTVMLSPGKLTLVPCEVIQSYCDYYKTCALVKVKPKALF